MVSSTRPGSVIRTWGAEEFKELQEFEEFKNRRCSRASCPTSLTIDSCHLSCASLRSGSFRQLLPA
jgi:hypothetical protein